MPMETVMVGAAQTLLQNVVYALPPVQVTVYTDGTTPTITQSNTAAFTANTAVTLTGGAATLAGGFIKITSGNVLCIFKTA